MKLLTCVADVSDLTWGLLYPSFLNGGDCLIAQLPDEGAPCAVAYIQMSSGDVFPCEGADVEEADMLGRAVVQEPIVHCIGDPKGATGQITVRLPKGNYLRACRWDRLGPSSAHLLDMLDKGTGAAEAAETDATIPTGVFRTLPQCGCGGSLGVPKLFGSFEEMLAYQYCAFCV